MPCKQPDFRVGRNKIEALRTRVAQSTFCKKCGLGHSGSQRLNLYTASKSKERNVNT